MKKLYFLFFAAIRSVSASAQLVLTQQAFEPVLGDISKRAGYDSSAAIPKQTGLNQIWDFQSALIGTTATATGTFVTMASAPQGTCCPNADIAEKQSASSYNFWDTTGTSFQLWGLTTSTISLTFTNAAVVAN